jgi:glycosyltransferase involved in cell wall biosynthesis
MRVLLIHNFYRKRYVGGEDKVFLDELRALRERLGQESVLSFTADNEGLSRLRAAAFLMDGKAYYRQVYLFVREQSIDLVHVHNTYVKLTPWAIRGAKDAGAHVVQTLHNYRWWCPNGLCYNPTLDSVCRKCLDARTTGPSVHYRCVDGSWAKSALSAISFQRYLRANLLDAVDRFFVLSQFQKGILESIDIPAIRMRVKPNFVSVPLVETTSRTGFAHVTRLDRVKGTDLLLQAWTQSTDRSPLVVGGVGPSETAVAKRSGLDETVQYVGRLDAQGVARTFAHARFAVVPSLLWETFGLTIVEAMAQGTPVIATDLGGRRELVQDGQNGFLCDATVDGLRAALKTAAELGQEDYDRMSACARATAAAYSEDRIMKLQLALYEELLNE